MSASDSRDDSHEVETNSPFYFNTSHWRAVDGMLEGVRERAGMMLLTGPTGSGKTMIMRAISEGLPEEAPALFLQYASLNFREFINFLHSSLRVEDEILDAPNKAVALREFLYVQAKRGETGVVFIDEAHNLEPDVLKMLPKLARFDTLEDGRIVGLQFVLIAGDDMREIMADPEYDEVRGKIAVDHTLRFFTRAELKQFLEKRLAPIARMTDEPITEDGIEEMGRFTGGSPRLIGMICSHTMLFAAENPGRSIDAGMVREAAEALMLSPVDDPFASEAADAEAVTGLFSEADLAGEERAPGPPEFSDVQTVYSTDSPDSAILRDTGSDHVSPPLRGEDRTVEPDASLYSADHEAMRTEERVDDDDHLAADRSDGPDGMEDGADDRDDIADDDDFDPAAFDRALDEEGEDDDFDDDDAFDDLDTSTATAKERPAIRKGGAAFLTRLGWRPRGTAAAKMVRTGRKSRKKADAEAAATPPAPSPARSGPKTRVVGARERKMKLAGVAASALVVLGLGYAAIPPVVAAIGGALAPAPDRGTGMAAIEAPALPGDPPLGDTVAIDIDNQRSPTTGGWGARVVMSDARGADSGTGTGAGMDVGIGAPGGEGVRGVLPIPGAAAGTVKGALDMVDRALGNGERNVGNDKVGGLFAAASDQVTGLRDRVARNGMTPGQMAGEVEAMIAKGDALFAERAYIAPRGANAYDAYREALALQPGNAAASAGIDRLREHFAKKAEGARDAQQWESANGFFETAIAISNLRAVK